MESNCYQTHSCVEPVQQNQHVLFAKESQVMEILSCTVRILHVQMVLT